MYKKLLVLNPIKIIIIIITCVYCKSPTITNAATANTINKSASLHTTVIDSNFINQYCVNKQLNTTIQQELLQFYKLNNYKSAWVVNDTLTPDAMSYYNLIQLHRVLLSNSRLQSKSLDSALILYEKTKNLTAANIPLVDVLLTYTYLITAPTIYTGYITTPATYKWYIPKPSINYVNLLLTQQRTHNFTHNVPYEQLLLQLQYYTTLNSRNILPIIPMQATSIIIDSNAIQYKLLKQYLYLVQDYKSTDTTTLGNATLIVALKSFQTRMGIDTTGLLNKQTLSQLNIPLTQRINTIKLNLERLRWLPTVNNGIVVNIAGFNLKVLGNGKQVWYTNVIVGRASKRSVIFTANLAQVILNPYWNIPRSIVNNEISGKQRRNRNYLRNNNMEYSNGNIRQKPGSDNALGAVKFIFPNPYNIYLHDTPTKLLFNKTNRALSHGCIRVYNPIYLATYLLQNYTSFNINLIDTVMATNKETPVPIIGTYPVYITYYTTWVTSNGKLHFASDVYGYDAPLAKAIEAIK